MARVNPETLQDAILQLDRYDLAEAGWLLAREIGRLHMVRQAGWATGRPAFEDLSPRELYDGHDRGSDDLALLCQAHWMSFLAERALSLNAEDIVVVDDWRGAGSAVQGYLEACAWPDGARTRSRGPLQDLEPLLGLMLEVMEIHAERDEVGDLLATAHLATEYLAFAAWQGVLGDAGEPRTLRERLYRSKRQWSEPGRCPRRTLAAHTCRKSGGATADEANWRPYLRGHHSSAAHLLEACAGPVGHVQADEGACSRPCDLATPSERAEVAQRAALVRILRASRLVGLRHPSPHGHFFSVPEPDEVAEAWHHTREQLLKVSVNWTCHAVIVEPSPGALPGLGSAVGAILGKGAPLAPATVITDLRDGARALLYGIQSGSEIPRGAGPSTS